jgi:hypothetical protein
VAKSKAESGRRRRILTEGLLPWRVTLDSALPANAIRTRGASCFQNGSAICSGGIAIKEPTANSLVPGRRFVAGDAGFVPDRSRNYDFDPAFFEVHQVAGSENNCHTFDAGVNLAVTKDLAAFHRQIVAQGLY